MMALTNFENSLQGLNNVVTQLDATPLQQLVLHQAGTGEGQRTQPWKYLLLLGDSGARLERLQSSLGLEHLKITVTATLEKISHGSEF